LSSYSQLQYYELVEIYDKRKKGWKISAIAKHLCRHKSTISREIKKNSNNCPALWTEMSPEKKAKYSYEKRQKRRNAKRNRHSLKNEEVRTFVTQKLIEERRSPRRIAKLLWSTLRVHLSFKAIYNFINDKARWLKEYLRRRGKAVRSLALKRRSYLLRGAPPKRSIDKRKKLVLERLELGHWEVDAVVSKQASTAAVLALRELKSRKAFFWKLPNLKAETVTRKLLPFFQKLPITMCKTITADNGGEFAELYKLGKVIPTMKAYYCHPYCAYERGSVENLNGELRNYFPKGTDFNNVTEEELVRVQNILNTNPMDVLNDYTPEQEFAIGLRFLF